MKYPVCLWALILVPSVVVSSCSTGRTGLTLNTRTITATELVKRVQTKAAALQSLTGKGSLWFEGPRGSGSAFFTMALRKPDSLLVRLKGPFGMEVGLVFMSRDRFVVYNGMENQVITGVPSGASMRSIIPVDLTYDQILSAFAGSFIPTPADGQPLLYSTEDDQFHIAYACGSDTCAFWIDPGAEIVTKYQVTNARGGTVIEAEAGKVLTENGVCVPRTVQVRFDNQQLSISYSSLDLNSSDLSFAFSIPSNAHITKR